jgi:primase-polymerase (primpol)-like protein
MRNKKQWVVWKLEWIEGKWKKPPYHPRTGRRLIGSTSHGEMGTYDEAVRTYQRGGYSGIGYCLREDDNLVVIDYDDCRDPETGLLYRATQVLINAVKSRTEASPLGTGIHIWSYGNIGRNRKDGSVEMYKNNQYVTWTGHLIPNTPAEIAYRLQDGENYWSIAHIYEEYFAQQLLRESRRENTGGGEASDLEWPAPFPLSAELRAALQRSDERLIERIKLSKNGERFERLWNAEERDANGGMHGGDFALILILLYWTNDDILWTDRLFRQSKRMRPKWDRVMVRYTYGQATIYRALTRRYGLDRDRDRRPAPAPVRNQTTEPAAPERETGEQAPAPAPASTPTPRRQARREVQFLEYEIPEAEQHVEETREGRANYLNAISRQIKADARAVLDAGTRGITALLAPPGVGKSHSVAEIGEMSTAYPRGQYDIAWVAERHEMIESVRALRHYHHIEACTRFNCPDHELHQALGARGYNTWSLHSQHNQPCDYMQQFKNKGSAVFQLPHVRTKYPTTHQGGIIIDELDLPKWLPERVVTADMLQRIRISESEESAVSRFALALQDALVAVGRNRQYPNGKPLFDLVDQTSNNSFYDLFVQLRNDSRFTNTRPVVEVDPYDTEALSKVEALPPVILPHILNAFDRELLRWDRGQGRRGRELSTPRPDCVGRDG